LIEVTSVEAVPIRAASLFLRDKLVEQKKSSRREMKN